MKVYDTLFEKVKSFHGHECPGIVLGTRLTMAAYRELGLDPMKTDHDLIVFMEIDRCGADAVQAITGCSLGHRNLKHKDFGKFAATFLDRQTGKAVRVSVFEKNRAAHESLSKNELIHLLSEIPEDEILKIEHVKVEIPKEDAPGLPNRKVFCEMCGEQVIDNRVVTKDGIKLCRNCYKGSYYTVID